MSLDIASQAHRIAQATENIQLDDEKAILHDTCDGSAMMYLALNMIFLGGSPSKVPPLMFGFRTISTAMGASKASDHATLGTRVPFETNGD